MQEQEAIFMACFTEAKEAEKVKKVRENRNMLLGTINRNIFTGIWYVYYELLNNYQPIIWFSPEFLMVYLRSHRGKLVDVPALNLHEYEVNEGEDPYELFCAEVVSKYEELSKNDLTEDTYTIEMLLEQYIMQYVTEQTVRLLQDSATIVSDSMMYKRKRLSGFDDMWNYLTAGINNIKNLRQQRKRRGIYTMGVDEPAEVHEEQKKISSFGIVPLDNALGGIMSGDMISLLGMTKTGKSRLMTYIMHQAIIHGVNVAVWSMENGDVGWLDMLRARHFDYLYNRTNHKYFVSDTMISHNELDTVIKYTDENTGEEKSISLRTLEAISSQDLFHNANYGTVTMIDEDLDISSYKTVLESAVTKGNARLVAVDYIGLMTDKTGGLDKRNCMVQAYTESLAFLKSKRIAGIFPAQMRQDEIRGMKSATPEDLAKMDIRTMAADSHEAIRTPTVLLGLVGTVEDIKAGHVTLVSGMCRNSAPFDPIAFNVDYGVCNFMPEVESIL